ncbi:NAD(P)H dehydrogenase (quinone) [Streptomyces narbonensis]
MASVVIAYFSGFGHTARFAAAVRDGAASVADTEVDLVAVDTVTVTVTEEQWLLLDSADAVIFGSPTYLGDVAAKFKGFMEQSSRRWKSQTWADKLAAGFVNSGAKSGDKLHALQTLSLFAGPAPVMLLAPAACWWARQTVESTDTVQPMSSAPSAAARSEARIRSQVPSTAHLTNRL